MNTSMRASVIATEQKAVDRAYDCHAARLAEMSGSSAADAAASGKDSIAARAGTKAAADAFGLGGESLVIMRVDTVEEGEDRPTVRYIGRRGVLDVETRDQVVVSWTTRAAMAWRNATVDAPDDVRLRRALTCSERTVEDYRDEISLLPKADVHPTPPVPSPGRAAERANKKTAGGVDDFLLRALNRARGGRMRDIVETIQRDQMNLVADIPTDVLVIQGGPGTGKSAVGLHRVTWLVDNQHFRAQDILVVGPHRGFLEYVGRVLPTLGTENVTAVEIARLWDGEIKGTDSPQARLVKSDNRMAVVLRRRVESQCRPDAVDSLSTPASDERDEATFNVIIDSVPIRVPRSEVADILDQARRAPGAYRAHRDRFRDLMVDRLLAAVAKVSTARGQDRKLRGRLERHRQVLSLVERTWPPLSPEEALRNLFNSAEKLRECASEVFSESEQATIQRPKADKADEDPWTVDDLVCLEELRFLIAGETPQRYRHIVIDEAQDLTPMQARTLVRRCPNGSMTVLGDLAQATGPHEYDSWDRLGELLSGESGWHVSELNTSYRVPTEIMRFVTPLARAIAPAVPFPTAVREAGEGAVHLVPVEPWQLLDQAISHASRLVDSDGERMRSIAVIVPDQISWKDEVQSRIDRAEALTAEGRGAISVMAARQAKGMEFDHVLVLDPATIAGHGVAGLRQLYVALTRSTQSLTVLHTAPLPAELSPERSGFLPDAHTVGAVPVGTDVRVRVLGRAGGRLWHVRAIAPEVQSRLLLSLRPKDTEPSIGSELDGWVYQQTPAAALVAVNDFGRVLISTGMTARYAAALSVVGELADGSVPDNAKERLSELKGMANRCLRRDQPDWLHVWRLLGEPDSDRLGALLDLAQNTRAAIISGDTARLGRLPSDLAASGWTQSLTVARANLLESASPEATTKEKEVAMAQLTVPEESAGSGTSFLADLTTAVQSDRECSMHEAVRFGLRSALHRKGLRPDDSPLIDLRCGGEQGTALFEVLGAGMATYQDIRRGVVRLMEVKHLSSTDVRHLFLVLAEAPSETWAAEDTAEAFGVSLIWQTTDGWDGQNLPLAFGS